MCENRNGTATLRNELAPVLHHGPFGRVSLVKSSQNWSSLAPNFSFILKRYIISWFAQNRWSQTEINVAKQSTCTWLNPTVIRWLILIEGGIFCYHTRICSSCFFGTWDLNPLAGQIFTNLLHKRNRFTPFKVTEILFWCKSQALTVGWAADGWDRLMWSFDVGPAWCLVVTRHVA